jgi:NAD(P)H-nitrite reductase large subunit
MWGGKAVQIDTDRRLVTVSDGTQLAYDRLLIATGGRPHQLSAPGAKHERINYFQSLADLDQLNAQMGEVSKAVVLGASFIAYELCHACVARGIPVEWVTRGPWFLHRYLDEEAGSIVDAIAIKNRVKVTHRDEVIRAESQNGSLVRVMTKSGRALEAEFVGCGLGLAMNLDFLEGTAVQTSHGVLVDEHLESRVPGIYAAGDVAESYDPLLGEHRILANWNKAIDQGRIAAKNMAGLRERYHSVPVYVSGLFDSRIMLIGLPDRSGGHLRGMTNSDPKHHRYRKLHFSGQQLVGAVLIGDFKGWRELRDLVEARENVAAPESLL